MRERTPGIGLVAAAAAALGICCGIPVLAAVGALGFLAGLSMTSWMLVVLGAVAAVVGGWRAFGRRRRAGVDSSACQPGRTHQPITGSTSERPILPTEH